MSGSRKWRGALACVLWASVIVCFLTTGTTRHPPRSVKLRGLPLRVDVGEGKGFWAAVQNAASRSKTDDQTHMESIVALAYSHMNSSKIVDRSDAIQALVRSMETTGLFTLVLGGKNLGKTFLKKIALQRCGSTVMVLSEDMRSHPGENLLEVLLQVANSTVENMTTEEEFKPFIPEVSAILAAAFAVSGDLGQAAAPIATYVRDVVSLAADKRKRVRFALDEFLRIVGRTSKKPAIVVDEANLALPGLTNGQDAGERREAKSALAAMTQWTKQDKLSSVVLISSEFGYPFRLQAAGLDLRDIGNIILIGEVPESDMIKMLQDDWGMDADLAEMFYNYFGGDIYTTKQALESLTRKKDTFDPFAVVRCPGLPSCVENAAARAHLENIAKQGFSLVKNVETDEGAKMIAEKNVGGVIDKDAITFGLPPIFTGTDKEWAVIPSSYHMKLLIARKLQQIPLPTSGRCFRNRFSFAFGSVLHTLFERGGGWRLNKRVEIYMYIYIWTITKLIDKNNTSIHTSSLQGGTGTAPPAVWVRQIRKDCREVHSMTV